MLGAGLPLRTGLRPLLLLVAPLLLGAAAHASGRSVETVLRRYVRASRGVNMRGTILTVIPTPTGARTSARSVVRRSDGRSKAVCREPASERGVVLTEDGVWTSRYDPRDKLIRRKRTLRSNGEAGDGRRLRLILRNYAATFEPDEQVAGRACYRMFFTPRQPRNTRVRLWIDKATGAEMRRDDLDAAGSTVSIVMCTAAEFTSDIPLSSVQHRYPPGTRTVNISRSQAHTSLAPLSRVVGFDVRAPLRLPSGYEFERAAAVQIGGGNAAHLLFTDGLSDLSILQTRRAPAAKTTLRAARVQPRMYGEVEVDYAFETVQVVVVGRAETSELVAVAESLDPGAGEEWLAAASRAFGGRSADLRSLRNAGMTAEAAAATLEIAVCARRSIADAIGAMRTGMGWRRLAALWKVPEATVARRLQSAGLR